jgi:DNA replication protein DnaC
MSDFLELINEIKNKKIDPDNYIKIAEYEARRKQEEIYQAKLYIDMTTPFEYRNADIKNIDTRIVNFCKNDKRFCWIHGIKGVGKTYSLYAIRNAKIYQGYKTFTVCMEGELNYDMPFKDIDAVDNLCISDSKMKFLADYYFNLIDWCWKCHKKLYLTSTKPLKEWLRMLSMYNTESAEAIASRLSNVTDLVELTGNDRRKGEV